MFFRRHAVRVAMLCGTLIGPTTSVCAQEATDHSHMMMMPADDGWRFMQDWTLFGEFNHQGGPRGGNELVVPNWWMGMADRKAFGGRLTFSGMLSLDSATVGRSGYRELFQTGEALDGRPLVDRQHPHDFLMQAAAIWRVPLGSSTGLTLAGGPAGEPALGPVAFMHRASALDNPTAPLGHHTFDSTHVAFGVVSAAVDHKRWTLEGSVFNGREPDDNRWNVEVGALDSVSARLWFRPSNEWDLQISSGRLTNPEELVPGNVQRSTTSAAWTRASGGSVKAFTIAYGRNDADEGSTQALFLEGARRAAPYTLYGRIEALQLHADLLDPHSLPHRGSDDRSAGLAVTVGGVRELAHRGWFNAGLGADVTVHAVPDRLQAEYGRAPVGLRLFLRVRPNSGTPMWNMRMMRPLNEEGHQMP